LLFSKGAFADFLMQHLGSESEDEDEEESAAILHDLQTVVGVKVERRSRGFSESDSGDRIRHRKSSFISQVKPQENTLLFIILN